MYLQEVKWYFPKLKHGHIIAVPLNDKPTLAYFLQKKQIHTIDPFDAGAYYDKAV